MKTAVEIMWDGLNNTHPEQWNEMLLNDKERISESEKQQIIKAYDDAFNYVVGGGFVAKTGEQYFEEVYNDKK